MPQTVIEIDYEYMLDILQKAQKEALLLGSKAIVLRMDEYACSFLIRSLKRRLTELEKMPEERKIGLRE